MIVATLQDDIIQDPSKLLKLSEVMLVFEPSSFEPEEFFKGSGQGQEPSLNRGERNVWRRWLLYVAVRSMLLGYSGFRLGLMIQFISIPLSFRRKSGGHSNHL
jgi:hypothetical protein